MHDIDAQISRISGQANYMEQLSKVTGDIFTVDREIYHETIDKCSKCDFNLSILAKRMLSQAQLNQSAKDVFTRFLSNKETYDIASKTFIVTQRKNKQPKESIDYQHLPKNVIVSSWMLSVRDIEKLTRKWLKLFFDGPLEEASYITFKETIDKTPELLDLAIFNGVPIDTELMFMNIYNCYKCSKIIINSFLNPMYNVEATIRKNYHLIDRIFRSKALQQAGTGISSAEDIIVILSKFITAKYRATLTNNNKHYVRLFMNLIDDNSSTAIDGAKFMEIMDSINLDQLNKNDNVYKFALGAKTAINNIFTNDKLDAEEIIASIQEIFNSSTKDKQEDKPPEDTPASKYDDLL